MGTLDPKQVYSAKTLAQALQVSVRTIYNLAARKEIPYVKITPGSSMRFPGWMVRRWLDTKAITDEGESYLLK